MTDVTISAVGDILIDRPEPESVFTDIAAIFETADISFGNFEGVMTDRHGPLPGAASATIVPTSNARGLRDARGSGYFDVLSLANNHALDAGYHGLEETIDVIRNMGIKTVGAGPAPKDAWEPVIVDTGRGRVAFVAVASVCRLGYEARGTRGGVASLTAVDYYAPRVPAVSLPGYPPLIISVTNEQDWQQLKRTIESVRQEAEFVVVSIHWGDQSRPYVITDFERDTAKRLSELDVDLILGHHHHHIRGVEFIGRMPVIYGLGHFVFDHPRYADELREKGAPWADWTEDQLEKHFGRYGHYPRASGLPFHDLSRWTTVAVIQFSSGKRPVVYFAPMHIDPDGTPRAVERGSSKWPQFIEVMDACAEDGYLDFKMIDKGQEVGGFPVIELQPKS